MGYLIGLDEAGYAPNLGPLCIAATVWRVPGSPRRLGDLYDCLAPAIARHPSQENSAPPGGDCPPRVTIADSKLLYNPQSGLKHIEHSVLAMLRVAGLRPRDWRACWDQLAPDCVDERNAVPWHDGFNLRLPLAADIAEVRQAVPHVKECFQAARIRLLGVRAVAIWPERFNRLVAECGSKGGALSRQTIALLADSLSLCKQGPVLVYGDKHGGRNFYGRFLQERFPDHLVEIYGEAADVSIYRFGPKERRIEVRFRVRGEEMLPVALASMVAKYLRELSMRAFNAYWTQQVPDLKATAGYPRDAHRFKREIATAQANLGIDDHVLWRAR